MTRYVDVHPDNPQPRAIRLVADVIRDGGVVVFPTDACFAFGAALGNAEGLARIRAIRGLGDRHHFTLMCADFGQLGQFVQIGTSVFRAVKAATPGPYTFILPATKDVPRRMLHPKRRTVGARIPKHPVSAALLAELGEPLLTSTVILPGSEDAMTDGWEIKEALDGRVDVVVDCGGCGVVPTTVVDLSGPEASVVRVGAADPSRFE